MKGMEDLNFYHFLAPFVRKHFQGCLKFLLAMLKDSLTNALITAYSCSGSDLLTKLGYGSLVLG
jgi:hypothetical protein